MKATKNFTVKIAAQIFIFLLPVISFAAGKDSVFVNQFGLLPNTREDAVKAVQQALAVCKTKTNPVLVFSKGRYDFWPQFSEQKNYYESNTTNNNPKRCPILIDHFTTLTIDAGGADFIYHGPEQPFTIDHSENISIKNVSIDWDIPLTAQATVINTTTDYIDLQIDTVAYPFTIKKGKLVFTGEDWQSEWWDCMEFEHDTRLIVPQTGDAGVLGNNWTNYTATQQPGGLVRLNYHFIRKPAIGNVLVMRHSDRDHAGIFIADSKNIQLENINIYNTAGLGILSQYAENLSFKNIQVVPNRQKGRYFSGHDDGCHFSNCKGKILVDGCSFEGLMDDPINVHGTAVQIIEKKSANQLLCRFMHEQSIGMEWARAGDVIGFINHTTMQTVATGTVVNFTALDSVNFMLTFSNPVLAAINIKDALENITYTPDITIRNCWFGVNRARGILISTPGKVLVEDNTFISSGSAILIAGDANQWFESGAVKDVLIRRNNFTDACLTSMYQFCEAIISIEPEIPKPDPGKAFHRNIVITENNFHPYDYPVLYAKSVDGLAFTNNTITRSTRFKPFHPNGFMFTFNACKKVFITGNVLQGDVLGKNINLEKMAVKELSVKPGESFTVQKD